MKRSVSVYGFRDAFRDADRMAGWTYDGLGALFDYLESIEEDTGQEIELDVIALCCEFSEYPSALDCIEDAGYGWTAPEIDEGEDADDYAERCEDEAREYLRDNTTLIEFDSGVIIQQF